MQCVVSIFSAVEKTNEQTDIWINEQFRERMVRWTIILRDKNRQSDGQSFSVHFFLKFTKTLSFNSSKLFAKRSGPQNKLGPL